MVAEDSIDAKVLRQIIWQLQPTHGRGKVCFLYGVECPPRACSGVNAHLHTVDTRRFDLSKPYDCQGHFPTYRKETHKS